YKYGSVGFGHIRMMSDMSNNSGYPNDISVVEVFTTPQKTTNIFEKRIFDII
ncbi:4880_t:CDS:1, partial [Funneliformis caledonium]